MNESKIRIRRLLLFVVGILALHTIAMMVFEGFSAGDALWLSLTTINTTGYGDLSSSSFLGRLFTVVLMYILGITLMAQLATEYIEFRIEKKDRKIKGLWNWNEMNDHIVIVNTPKHNPTLYLQRLATQLRNTPRFAETPICIVTERFPDGLPVSLTDANVVLVSGEARNSDVLERSNISAAESIILISPDSSDNASDSTTIDILFHLKQMNLSGRIIAEAVKDENRARFQSLGASSVIRPIRAYPELIVRALEAPGTEQFMENLFSHQGDRPVRFDISLQWDRWCDLACQLMQNGLGTPVGYIDTNGRLFTNPAPFKPVIGTAILLLVHHKHIPEINEVKQALLQNKEEPSHA